MDRPGFPHCMTTIDTTGYDQLSAYFRLFPVQNIPKPIVVIANISLPYGSKHCLRRYLALQIVVNYNPNTSQEGTWIPKAINTMV